MLNKYLSLIIFAFSIMLADLSFADDMEEKVVYSSSTQTLILPKVYVMDAEGNMTEMVAAELKLSKGSEPYEFKVEKLTSVMESHDHDSHQPAVDSYGCVFPETWHAEMNHCMVQN